MKLNIKVKGKWYTVWGFMVNEVSHIITPASVEEIDANGTATEFHKDEYESNQKRLGAAFDKVKNKVNWKLPIDALLDPKEDLNLISEAITHFTGSPSDYVTVKRKGKEYIRVRAAGYYQCIGA
jgi:hypothetical protein